jgi:hypothetical protein
MACLSAEANSISVSVNGFGYLGGDGDGLSANAGKLFSAFSAAPDGPPNLAFGTVGVPMSLEFSPYTYSGLGYSDVTIGAFTTDIIYGGIDFFSSFTVPASALTTGSFTAPVTAFGSLAVYQDLTYGQGYYTQGPLLGTLQFSGQGTATFDIEPTGGDGFLIVEAFGNYKGAGTLDTTTTIPEPGSLLLVGTGLTGIAFSLKRRVKCRL